MSRGTTTRVYVGNLSSRTRERDLDDAFYRFGRIQRIDLKQGFGFVEFEDDRDAHDAIRRMDGEDIDGRRVMVQASKGGSDRGARDAPRGGRGGGYRVEAEGLDARVSWQDLKDFARESGDVAYTDVWMDQGEKKGVIEYTRKEDMEDALRKLHNTELEKHRCFIKLYAVKSDKASRSRSKSAKRSTRGRSRSRSRSKSPKKKNSRSRSRSKSPKKNRKSSRSRSRSKSPKKDRKKSRSRSRSAKKDDKKKSRSRSRSKSPAKKDDRNKSKSKSRSRSRSGGRS